MNEISKRRPSSSVASLQSGVLVQLNQIVADNGFRVMAYDVLVRIAEGFGVPRAWMGLAYHEVAEPVGPAVGEEVVDERGLMALGYTSGTTGRPKGAVLRHEALLWNGVMSRHMHALDADDHVLTVLPFFHVGGLNIQTTPALHHGAFESSSNLVRLDSASTT